MLVHHETCWIQRTFTYGTCASPVLPAGLAGPSGAILGRAAERALGAVEWDNLRGTDHICSAIAGTAPYLTSALIGL